MDFKDTAAAALLPPGFAALMAKIEAKHRAQAPVKRRGVLADVERALALGKAPPLLEFKSESNYTYNRHAEALYKLWQAGDSKALADYPIGAKNTYARALARYRDLLVKHLQEAQQ